MQAFGQIGRKGDKLSVNLFRLAEVEIDVTTSIKAEIADLITTKQILETEILYLQI